MFLSYNFIVTSNYVKDFLCPVLVQTNYTNINIKLIKLLIAISLSYTVKY